MKTIKRSKIYLPMAAMVLSAAIALPAAAQQLRSVATGYHIMVERQDKAPLDSGE